ncbi:MAG: hypothetical protein PHI58_03680 [Candidatus Omnitrophica bacterium]|nr:hypothetical protein [Candidatus Omnitrophota bacterium]
MKIASIGLHIQHKDVANISFTSSTSLLDYDMLIWDPSDLFEEYNCEYSQPTYQGYPNLNDDDSPRIREDVKRRRGEIIDFLKNNRTIIIILPPPKKCYCASGKYDYAGSGKNRSTTRYVDELDLCSIVPIEDFTTVMADGYNIELREQEPFKKYWSKMNKRHYYSAYLSSSLGKPFLFIKGTDKVVGTWVPTKNGIFLMLPSLVIKPKSEVASISAEFIDAINELISGLQKTGDDYLLPPWTKQYMLPPEEAKRSQVEIKESELTELTTEIAKLKKEFINIEKNKILLSGSGKILEEQVAYILGEIGFIVERGTAGRDDLILRYGDKVAVVEIKGTSKSASEKNAAQLEKWVTEYITNNDTKPKGILIVNAYCDIPLNERIEPPFPHQMIKYSINREHCLITTSQLLGIYYAVLSDSSQKDVLINEVFNTTGVYSKFSEYQSFISIKKKESDLVANKD